MTQRRPAIPPVVRRWGPWVVGAIILAIVITRVPFAAFSDAMTQGPIVALAAANVVSAVVTLCTDSFATWLGLRTMNVRKPLATVVAVRGATYLLFLINYTVWQGSFGYYLYRSGISGLRATGVTLLLAGTNLAMLLVVTGLAYATQDVVPPYPAMTITLLVGIIGYAAYLVLVAVKPAFLARREVLAPMFEIGVKGNLIAVAGRIPHVIFMILGMWFALRVWGIAVPLAAGLVLVPIVILASVIPISPAGLGTVQAMFLLFFTPYADGATPEARTAIVLAFSVAQFVLGVGASLLLGATCAAVARKLDVEPPPAKADA